MPTPAAGFPFVATATSGVVAVAAPVSRPVRDGSGSGRAEAGRTVPGDQPPLALTDGVWPMFRFDLGRTSFNSDEKVAAPPLDLAWAYETKGKI